MVNSLLQIKYRILFSLSLVLFVHSLLSQNLVMNPGFEELQPIDSKPGINAKHWKTYKNADLANLATGIHLTPPSWGGKRIATNYSNLLSVEKGRREYLVGKLSQPLVGGQKYEVKFYVKLTDISNCGASHLGIMFTEEPIAPTKTTLGYLIVKTPTSAMVVSDSILQKSEWKIVSGEITAKGGERILTIGYFASPSQIKRTFHYKKINSLTPECFTKEIFDAVSVVATSNVPNENMTTE